VTDERRIISARHGVYRRNETVDDGIEVLVTNRGKDFQLHALEFQLPRTGIVRAAVNGDIVPARDEPRGQMFRERFKPAIVRRNTTRSENRDAHRFALHQTTKAFDASRKFFAIIS